MIKIAVLEDNDKDAELLERFIDRYFVENGGQYMCNRYSTACSFLDKYSADRDIVFLDIELPDIDGLKTAHKLREIDENTVIVFITNMAQFAVNGYEVNAFDFMIKPLRYPVFALKMGRLIKHILKNRDNNVTVIVKSDRGVYRLGAKDIMYVEVMNHNLIYHLENGTTVSARGQMKDIESQLSVENGFFKCNRCYLVNLKFVTEFCDSTLTCGNDKLLISRGQRKQFLSTISKYL